jgi:uncharacterized protein (DUF697 family)
VRDVRSLIEQIGCVFGVVWSASITTLLTTAYIKIVDDHFMEMECKKHQSQNM